MTLRLALSADERDRLRPSTTIARAARVLSCDPTTVRALLRSGGLEGHHIGKSDSGPAGVRVFLDSIDDYQRRHAIEATAPNAVRDDGRPRRRRPSTAAHREAVAYLRSMGSRI